MAAGRLVVGRREVIRTLLVLAVLASGACTPARIAGKTVIGAGQVTLGAAQMAL